MHPVSLTQESEIKTVVHEQDGRRHNETTELCSHLQKLTSRNARRPEVDSIHTSLEQSG